MVFDQRIEFDCALLADKSGIVHLDYVRDAFRNVLPERLLELMPDLQFGTFLFQGDVKHVADNGCYQAGRPVQQFIVYLLML